MSNRAQRRAAGLRSLPPLRGPQPLCAPGHHSFQEVTATVKGEAAATHVLCLNCRRTFQQVMEESPEDLAEYRRFLEAERAAVKHSHPPDPDGLPVEGCAGCERQAALDHSQPEELT